jgi:hypothetical protein
VPSAGGGSSPSGRDDDRDSGAPLSREAATKLAAQGGSERVTLERIATSTALGAPERRPAGESGPDSKPRGSASAPSAAIDALGDDGGGNAGWLLLFLPVATLVAAIAAARRRRGTS